MLRGSRVEVTWPLVPREPCVTAWPGLLPTTPVFTPFHSVWTFYLDSFPEGSRKLRLAERRPAYWPAGTRGPTLLRSIG